MLKFLVRLGPPFCMKLFRIFEIGAKKSSRYKFQQNRTINEEFDFCVVKGAGKGGGGGVRGAPISKFGKTFIQNGGPNPHRKFQHSSSIRVFENL